MRHEVLTPAQMYEVDELAERKFKVTSLKLMENAGKAVVREVTQRFSKRNVAIICGPGNNGCDGYVVARLLAAKKWPVKVYALSAARGDAAVMAGKWKGAVGTFEDFERSIGGRSGPKLIVDAMFGAGLNRDMPGRYADCVHGAGYPIVAIDVPSGLDGLTGQVRGASVIADLTVTFHRKKPGHLLYPGRRLCGELVLADIGMPDEATDALPIRIFENTRPEFPELRAEAHKFTRGHALVWSGGEFSTGASRLAAQAAARVGAGLVSLVGSDEALRVHAAHVTSIMLKPERQFDELMQDKRVKALCIGPGAGLSADLKARVTKVLSGQVPVVLDADALSVFADEPDQLFAAIKAVQGRDCYLTPHEGEFMRLFRDLMVGAYGKVERAQLAARRSGAIVVLKGPDTVIANPNGFAFINTNAPPKLATAGSGDVLAGILTGLLAQGIDGIGAANAAVWLHGEAANRISRPHMMAEDLIDAIRQE